MDIFFLLRIKTTEIVSAKEHIIIYKVYGMYLRMMKYEGNMYINDLFC